MAQKSDNGIDLAMKITDFDVYAKILKEKSGLVLTQDKTYLLESRLAPVSKEFGFDSLEAMTMAVNALADPKLIKAIVEAMTTNETSFFRDTRPFDMFRDHLLTYMRDARSTQKRLKIWCAAASSGQEPYTLSMIIKEAAEKHPGWKFDILGTDISDDILDKAREGIYSQFEVQRGLPITLLMKYFTQDGANWKINDDVKSIIRYQNFNLLDPMTTLGDFDIIFCRNVLIYFDENTKGHILANMVPRLADDGFLMLGGAETVLGITDQFVPLPNKRGVYVKKDSPHLSASSDTAALSKETPPPVQSLTGSV